jgi:hypothetical protein
MKRSTPLLPVALSLILAATMGALAQRARTVSDPNKPDNKAQPTTTATTTAPAPASVKAKYEGGVVGYRQKQTGTLKFDDASSRLVFQDKSAHELFPIPYRAIISIYPETHAVQPTAARVAGAVPAPYGLNMLSMLARQHVRYLIVQYSDPDTHASGVTSFKLENKETLNSVLSTLAQKAELTQRGDAYVRTDKASTTP